VLVAVTVFSSSAGVASASRDGTSSPQVLYRAALAAGHAQRSVHWQSRAAAGGALVAMRCDVGRASGIQRISYSNGTESGNATVVVAGGNVYLRGDAFTLTGFMGFNPIAAAKYAGAWVEIPRLDPRFASVSAGVMLRSAVDQVAMVGPYRLLPNTAVHGRKVLAVAGKAPGSDPADVVLYVAPGASHLPVGAVSESSGVATSIFFSRWNEPVRVNAPAGATPISKTGL
jgi:hypothetical protein